jgi:hypothetical protein
MLQPRVPRSVAVDRTTILGLAALVAASVVAWVVLVSYEPPMGFLGFTVGIGADDGGDDVAFDRAPLASPEDLAWGWPSGTWPSGASSAWCRTWPWSA